MDKKKTKKPKRQLKTPKGKTRGKSLEKDVARALKEVKEPLKELRGALERFEAGDRYLSREKEAYRGS